MANGCLWLRVATMEGSWAEGLLGSRLGWPGVFERPQAGPHFIPDVALVTNRLLSHEQVLPNLGRELVQILPSLGPELVQVTPNLGREVTQIFHLPASLIQCLEDPLQDLGDGVLHLVRADDGPVPLLESLQMQLALMAKQLSGGPKLFGEPSPFLRQLAGALRLRPGSLGRDAFMLGHGALTLRVFP